MISGYRDAIKAANATENKTARAWRAVGCGAVLDYAKFWFTKSQLTRFHQLSTNFGRALR
jgi:hypothetical protein